MNAKRMKEIRRYLKTLNVDIKTEQGRQIYQQAKKAVQTATTIDKR